MAIAIKRSEIKKQQDCHTPDLYIRYYQILVKGNKAVYALVVKVEAEVTFIFVNSMMLSHKINY